MFDRNLMKLPGMHAVMAALALLALLQAAAIAGLATSLGTVIAELWGGAALGDVLPGTIAFVACFALQRLLKFGQETMLDRYALDRAEDLHRQLLEKTFGSRTMLAERAGAATVATTLTEGIDEVLTYIRIIPPKTVGMAAISIPLLVAVFATDWPSGIILAVMFPVIIFFMVLLGKQARERSERQYGAYTVLSNRFLDTLRGMEVIRAFSASEQEGESVHSFSEKLRLATVRTMTTATLSSAVLDLCATLGVAAVAMMLAFRLMDGSVDLATALTALVLAPEYFTPIREFAGDFHASLDGKNALSAMLDLLGSTSGAAELDEGAEPSEAWNDRSTLEFSNVGFEYDEDGSGVHGISLTLSGHEKVALVGRSGAGKSTICKLVAGFASPTSGSVLLDGRAADLAQIAWQSQVRLIPQHPYIFRMSLADNIRFYNPAATDEQVAHAAQAVGLGELVAELPDGLETLVGEGARGLSGGQAHRVALARILVDEDARVLVFDEPTAHLDIETELELKQRLLPLMEGKLVLFATHRLHWAADMDRVIDLDALDAEVDDAENALLPSEEVDR